MVTLEVKAERSSEMGVEWSSNLKSGAGRSSDLGVGWKLEQWKREMGRPLTPPQRLVDIPDDIAVPQHAPVPPFMPVIYHDPPDVPDNPPGTLWLHQALLHHQTLLCHQPLPYLHCSIHHLHCHLSMLHDGLNMSQFLPKLHG